MALLGSMKERHGCIANTWLYRKAMTVYGNGKFASMTELQKFSVGKS